MNQVVSESWLLVIVILFKDAICLTFVELGQTLAVSGALISHMQLHRVLKNENLTQPRRYKIFLFSDQGCQTEIWRSDCYNYLKQVC